MILTSLSYTVLCLEDSLDIAKISHSRKLSPGQCQESSEDYRGLHKVRTFLKKSKQNMTTDRS